MSGVFSGGLALGGEASQRFECSRAGCRESAPWAIQWRNPKIHTEDRRKIWLACDAHLPVLRTFLEDRSFPLTVCEAGALDD
ncbi:hypothetical protein MUN76_03055 [Leucobacter rhizosphaerae]|uniref:Acetone carboxylase n=1 Tax=Leucobacter rhizosphaerae TaxID=2932245 RepID=A0ABY4FXI0_9MICO|nr:hypothetical protein [Leucobacter rhizosphaerae]UOQ60970.1 hypothetical protein MUN76_03055 [Leucobacter rhizosphaerae]